MKLSNEQRRKIYNILISTELDNWSYNNFDTIVTSILVYGSGSKPYDELHDQELLNTLYDSTMDHHDLETFDDVALIQWLDEQKNICDYMGKL